MYLLENYHYCKEGEKVYLISRPRPKVRKFAWEMEKQLRANEYKGGWKNCDSDFLLNELKKNYNKVWMLCAGDPEVLRRCANIANFAMMIADNWGGLTEEGE